MVYHGFGLEDSIPQYHYDLAPFLEPAEAPEAQDVPYFFLLDFILGLLDFLRSCLSVIFAFLSVGAELARRSWTRCRSYRNILKTKRDSNWHLIDEIMVVYQEHVANGKDRVDVDGVLGDNVAES